MYIYNTINLQIVQVFKDPRTVDQTERAVQAQQYSPKTINAQNKAKQIQDRSKVREITYQNRASKTDQKIA